jgi:hypothetical protein
MGKAAFFKWSATSGVDIHWGFVFFQTYEGSRKQSLFLVKSELQKRCSANKLSSFCGSVSKWFY